MVVTMPSEPVRELIRRGAAVIIDSQQQWVNELDAEVLAPAEMQLVRDDPELSAAIRATNRANLLHWAAANVANPGAPVAANLGPEPLHVARDLVRRGLNESVLQAYRFGQNAAWQRWMSIVFELTSDPGQLRELLEVSSRSIFAFIDATITGVSEQMTRERAEIAAGNHAERLQVVELLMSGAPVNRSKAEMTLGYRLDQAHTAVIAWIDGAEGSVLAVRVPDLVERASGRRPLAVAAGADVLWLWAPADLDDAQLGSAAADVPGLRMAIGPPAPGLDGFRRSHLDAVTTARMMARLRSPQGVARFGAVQLVALIAQNPDLAQRFVADTLGGFATANPGLHQCVAAYIAEGCSVARTAERLYTHRNTVLRRLARADTLLPRPLPANLVNVAVALDVRRWSGQPA